MKNLYTGNDPALRCFCSGRMPSDDKSKEKKEKKDKKDKKEEPVSPSSAEPPKPDKAASKPGTASKTAQPADLASKPGTVSKSLEPADLASKPGTASKSLEPADIAAKPGSASKSLEPADLASKPGTASKSLEPADLASKPGTASKSLEPANLASKPGTASKSLEPADLASKPGSASKSLEKADVAPRPGTASKSPEQAAVPDKQEAEVKQEPVVPKKMVKSKSTLDAPAPAMKNDELTNVKDMEMNAAALTIQMKWKYRKSSQSRRTKSGGDPRREPLKQSLKKPVAPSPPKPQVPDEEELARQRAIKVREEEQRIKSIEAVNEAQKALDLASSSLDRAVLEMDSPTLRQQVLTRKEGLQTVTKDLGVVLSSLKPNEPVEVTEVPFEALTEEDREIQGLRMFREQLRQLFGGQELKVVEANKRSEEAQLRTRLWAEGLVKKQLLEKSA